jgi:hypothetical protein
MSWNLAPRPPLPPPSPSTYIDWGPALPERYGGPRILALVRDPETLFATWEGGDRLRARDLTDGSVREQAVGPWGCWYFGAASEHEYEVELLEGGRVVAVSGRVRIPRKGPATLVDEDWAPTPEQLEVLRAQAGGFELHRRGLFGGMSS